MKKTIGLLLLGICSSSVNAQYRFTTSLSTTTTNVWIQLPLLFAETGLNSGIFQNRESRTDKFMFLPQVNFPVSLRNSSPDDFGTMRGGYARAFSAPWKHLGDYSIGIFGAWDHYDKPTGFYAGLSYKSKEVVFKDEDLNDRVHYLSPEVGLRFKFGDVKGLLLEFGSSFDCAFSYKGKMHDYSKDAVNSGFCANIGIGHWDENGYIELKFSAPLYNFYNKSFSPDNGVTKPFNDVYRNIGVISLIWRKL